MAVTALPRRGCPRSPSRDSRPAAPSASSPPPRIAVRARIGRWRASGPAGDVACALPPRLRSARGAVRGILNARATSAIAPTKPLAGVDTANEDQQAGQEQGRRRQAGERDEKATPIAAAVDGLSPTTPSGARLAASGVDSHERERSVEAERLGAARGRPLEHHTGDRQRVRRPMPRLITPMRAEAQRQATASMAAIATGTAQRRGSRSARTR